MQGTSRAWEWLCRLQCHFLDGWEEKEGEAKTLFDLGFRQLTNVLDVLLKRDQENQSRGRNETLWKIKRDHSANDIYQDTYCNSIISMFFIQRWNERLHLLPGLPPTITKHFCSLKIYWLKLQHKYLQKSEKNLHKMVRFSSKQVPRAVPTLSSK